jgi:GNAT superfamily N-acetyltransferase
LWFICGGKIDDEEIPYPYEVAAFFVDPDYWGKGIWQKLFDAFRQRIGNNQCFLRTFAGSKAERFYYQQGWTRFWTKQTILGEQTYTEAWFVFGEEES